MDIDKMIGFMTSSPIMAVPYEERIKMAERQLKLRKN